MAAALKPALFQDKYASVFDGDAVWQKLPVPEGSRYAWDPKSTYVQDPPFFRKLPAEPSRAQGHRGRSSARRAGRLGHHRSHLSRRRHSQERTGRPLSHGPRVPHSEWNTFGARRGNHEVMMRGTFGNVRIKNALVPDKEGNWTLHFPTGEVISIYDAAMRYIESGTPLVILTGKEYGTGSSRDWAAKGPSLLGVKAVIAESYERIHRSNLVGMGVLPLAYEPGTTRASLGLTGREQISISGIAQGLAPGGKVTVTATSEDGKKTDLPRRRTAQLTG